MLTCPHCGEQAFSMWSKLAIGPTTSARCRHCLKPVGVSWMAKGLILLLFAVMVVLRLVMQASLLYWGLIVIFAAGCLFVHVKWVPLVKQ